MIVCVCEREKERERERERGREREKERQTDRQTGTKQMCEEKNRLKRIYEDNNENEKKNCRGVKKIERAK